MRFIDQVDLETTFGDLKLRRGRNIQLVIKRTIDFTDGSKLKRSLNLSKLVIVLIRLSNLSAAESLRFYGYTFGSKDSVKINPEASFESASQIISGIERPKQGA
jgi:hypothetical protein